MAYICHGVNFGIVESFGDVFPVRWREDKVHVAPYYTRGKFRELCASFIDRADGFVAGVMGVVEGDVLNEPQLTNSAVPCGIGREEPFTDWSFEVWSIRCRPMKPKSNKGVGTLNEQRSQWPVTQANAGWSCAKEAQRWQIGALWSKTWHPSSTLRRLHQL